MGSFRLVAGNRHLHRYYNFAGRAVETKPKSLRLSCGSELTRQRNFATFRTAIVRPAVPGASIHLARTSPLNLPAPGRRQLVYVIFDLAQTCVLVKQLLGRDSLRPPSLSTFSRKLRGQFAEFFNNPSPVGLRIFFLPTCVGFAVMGTSKIHTAFLAIFHPRLRY